MVIRLCFLESITCFVYGIMAPLSLDTNTDYLSHKKDTNKKIQMQINFIPYSNMHVYIAGVYTFHEKKGLTYQQY
ncbi:ORF95 [White spot syndrome virus]|uniref:Wsv180 n=4 Tax=White spot syndrome virus TaxID=342409 RepID=Q77J63_WSSVS|nr:wsv180 [Shrimp white spot syndrome virus]YP_009220532.1 hypothetical protein SWSSV_gp058 [White spot syndrome virus]AAF18484.1 unknown [White spot syndrome virus]AAK77764.1 ORF95 [White spot syndrome virus]AAL33184.1 wsv180 [Shrimp white spot syndrome virus]AAL89104.1 WSSV236 [Shrimp white spot syndrome virus]AFX59557.1 wsv180 [White spot syndrome virus]